MNNFTQLEKIRENRKENRQNTEESEEASSLFLVCQSSSFVLDSASADRFFSLHGVCLQWENDKMATFNGYVLSAFVGICAILQGSISTYFFYFLNLNTI